MHNDPTQTPPTIPYDAFQSACNALALRAVPYVEHPAGGWRPADPSPDYDLGTYLTNRAIDAVPDVIDADGDPDLWDRVVNAFLCDARWVAGALIDVAVVAVRSDVTPVVLTRTEVPVGVWVVSFDTGVPVGGGRFVLGSDPIDGPDLAETVAHLLGD